MPLNTQIIRDRQPLKLRWGWWHVGCMMEAAEAEGANLLSEGAVTLESAHRFVDPSDGEILSLQPGDVLTAYR